MRKGYKVLFYRTYHIFHWTSRGDGDGGYRKRSQKLPTLSHQL
ncbi:hypothetical protein NEOC65_002044 [Neochlamydia sp. AcF65]|nr:hypothetical protein [Neochlamydia sp. AcF65]